MIHTSSITGLYNQGLQTHVKGLSSASDTSKGVLLELHRSTRYDGYANAQIDDYRVDQRNHLRWQANVHMTLRARFSCDVDELGGTAGFGFWNAPFGISERRFPVPPATAWFFFGGPRTNLPIAKDVAGNGWKAASMDARNGRFYALLPTAPLAIPLMRWRAAYLLLWPIAQRAMRAYERLVSASLNEWHEYSIKWTRESVRFEVDGQVVYVNNHPPASRMGFVAWLDNQYMVATPQGTFAQGVTPVATPRSLEIADLTLTRLEP